MLVGYPRYDYIKAAINYGMIYLLDMQKTI